MTTSSGTEVWKDIPGYEGEYQASTLGNIKSLQREVRCGYKGRGKRIVKETILAPGAYAKSGHVSVVLRRGTNGKPVHQLITSTFLGPTPEGKEILHIDGNPKNNRLDNLKFGSRTDNILDVYKQGKAWRKLNLKQVDEIRELLRLGYSGAFIARKFNISQVTVSKIKTGKSYYWYKGVE